MHNNTICLVKYFDFRFLAIFYFDLVSETHLFISAKPFRFILTKENKKKFGERNVKFHWQNGFYIEKKKSACGISFMILVRV